MIKKNIRVLVGMAIWIAAYVVLSRFSLNFGPLKITLSGLPIIIAAITLGPVEGLTVGLIGALIGQFLDGYGITPTTALWILPAGVRGLIVGLIMKKKDPLNNTTAFITSIIISSLVVTFINTFTMYVDSKMYGYYTYYYVFGSFLTRVSISIITAIVYIIVVPLIIQPLMNIINKKGKEKKMTTASNRRSLFNLTVRTKRLYVLKPSRARDRKLMRRPN